MAARSTRVSGTGDRARASVEPGRLLDNGNNKVGQEKGERVVRGTRVHKGHILQTLNSDARAQKCCKMS